MLEVLLERPIAHVAELAATPSSLLRDTRRGRFFGSQHLLADSPDEITALTAFPSKPTFTDFSAPVNWQFGLAPPIFILKLGGGAGYK